MNLLGSIDNRLLALIPLIPPAVLLLPLLLNDSGLSVRSSRLVVAYILVALFGFVATNRLVPNIKNYTLRKGISGRDLGKLGTSVADKEMYVVI
jgi:hypothetical protein